MILFGKIVLGVAGTAVAGVGLLCSEGMIEVKVVERQPEVHHVYVIAPAMLAPIAVHFAPQRELSHAAAEDPSLDADHSRGSRSITRDR